MKRILIIGKNSYVGDKFAEYIGKFEGFSVKIADSRDGAWKEENFAEFDAVFHVAGIAHDTGSKKDAEKYYKTNRDLAVDVANYAKEHGVRQFIFMSSMLVYNGVRARNITAHTAPKVKGVYGDSKLQADLALQEMNSESFKVAVLRPPMVFGEGCKGNYPRLVKLAEKLPVFPKIKNQRSMLHIDNLCEFVRLTVENESAGVFFPQNPEYFCTSDLVKEIAAAKGKKIRLTRLFNWAVWLAYPFSKSLRKLFGNLTYDKSLSGAFKSPNKEVLLVCSTSDSVCNFRRGFIKYLVDKGYGVNIIVGDTQKIDEIRKFGVKVFHVAVENTSINPFKKLKYQKKLQYVIKETKPDTVFSFMMTPAIFGTRAAKKSGVKNIFVMLEGMGRVFTNGGFKTGVTRLILSLLMKKSFKYLHKLFVLNTDDREYVVRRKFVSSENVAMIPGIGVNLSEFAVAQLPTKQTCYFMAARLLPEKGVIEFCKAAEIVKAEFPDARFVLAGAEDTIKSKDLEKYRAVEHVGVSDKIAELYADCSVYVLPSYREGMPRTIMEAMSVGRPIITTDSVGCRDTVKNGVNGYIVPPKNVIELAEKMKGFYNNFELQEKMGRESRLLAESKYDENLINAELFDMVFGSDNNG